MLRLLLIKEYDVILFLFDLMQYLKHLAFNTAKRGWNVVVSNHRGLGGVSVTVSGVVVEIFML